MYRSMIYFVLLAVLINSVLTETVNDTDAGEPLQDGESRIVNGKTIYIMGNTSVVKHSPDCGSKPCQNLGEISSTTRKTFVQRINFAKTPPESLNFLATAPTFPTKKDELLKPPKDKISIFSLNERGRMHDWPGDYDLNPVYGQEANYGDENNGYDDEREYDNEVLEGRSTESTPMLYSDQSSTEVYKPDSGRGYVKGATLKTKDRHVVSLRTVTKKPKFQNLGKVYSVFKPSAWQKPTSGGIYNLEVTDKSTTNLGSTQNGTELGKIPRKPHLRRFGLVPDVNGSFRLVPYPEYLTAKPIVKHNKLAMPYPLFVIPDKRPGDSEDERKSEIENLVKSNQQDFKVPEVEISLDYREEAEINDEDYDPHAGGDPIFVTRDYYKTRQEDATVDTPTNPPPLPVKTIFPTLTTKSTKKPTSKKWKPTTIDYETSLPFVNRTSVAFFTFIFTQAPHTKYPNPYKKGSIYFYYDCEKLIDEDKSDKSDKNGGDRGRFVVNAHFIVGMSLAYVVLIQYFKPL